jgi:hypothetical protein
MQEKPKHESIIFIDHLIILALIYAVAAFAIVIRTPALNAIFDYEGTIPINLFHIELYLWTIGAFVLPVIVVLTFVFKNRKVYLYALIIMMIGIIFEVAVLTIAGPSITEFIFHEHTSIAYGQHQYKAVSVGDWQTYQQYAVYRCDETGTFCQRILSPYRADDVTIHSYYDPDAKVPADCWEFVVEEDHLYFVLQFGSKHVPYAVPTAG